MQKGKLRWLMMMSSVQTISRAGSCDQSLIVSSSFPLLRTSGEQEFACNGTIVEHPEYGEVIQFQGDQRNNICQFLTKIGIAKQEQLKIHGF